MFKCYFNDLFHVYIAVNFNFMMRVYANNKKSPEGINALAMTLHTLKMMAKGGMYDHVAKVFPISVDIAYDRL